MNDIPVGTEKQSPDTPSERRSPPSQCQRCALIQKCIKDQPNFVAGVIEGHSFCLEFCERLPVTAEPLSEKIQQEQQFGNELRGAREKWERAYERAGRPGVGVHQPCLIVGEDMIKYKSRLPGRAVGGGRRGFISGFSRKSRARLMQKFACLKPTGDVWFITLTYSDDFVEDFRVWKQDLEDFFRKLQGEHPDVGVLWREELVIRKSGLRVGAYAPHFHLVVFGIDMEKVVAYPVDGLRLPDKDEGKCLVEFKLQGWVKQAWYQVNHVSDINNLTHGAFVRLLDTRRKVYSYVSKYTAKVGDDFGADGAVIDPETGEVLPTGRIWGEMGKVPHGSVLTIPLSWNEVRLLKMGIKKILRGRGEKSAEYAERIQEMRGDFYVLGIGRSTEEETFPVTTLLDWLDAGGVPDD